MVQVICNSAEDGDASVDSIAIGAQRSHKEKGICKDYHAPRTVWRSLLTERNVPFLVRLLKDLPWSSSAMQFMVVVMEAVAEGAWDEVDYQEADLFLGI